jgi:hypothetical protein
MVNVTSVSLHKHIHFFNCYKIACKGLNGLDGNGDITMPENLKEFEKLVLASTSDRGVHFVMADGVRKSFFSLFFPVFLS